MYSILSCVDGVFFSQSANTLLLYIFLLIEVDHVLYSPYTVVSKSIIHLCNCRVWGLSQELTSWTLVDLIQ
ncbi:hypothetical protein L6452_17340 [Arctium lappa]|uniref:Uncharacterized protein n=1 Tax=Arctium lappa TaxID=4217 RepID=A0ACB9C338_ARCLA|nr:hypothetical protein L6452_17340 [Arctium lappa]